MILWLTCTHGRFKCLQRNLRCYLDQEHDGYSAMFICNSGKPLKLDPRIEIPENKQIYIDNCGIMNFQSVGEKYNHALKMSMSLFPHAQYITSADDDDIFLPDHLQQGQRGIEKATDQGRCAYKPQKSYFRYRHSPEDIRVSKAENNLEPSIFVQVEWLEQYGYAPVSVKYHQQWLDPLIEQDKILIDPEGKSTLIYNWGDTWDTYKMSGSGEDTQQNFLQHKRRSIDMGQGFLTPIKDNSIYYNEVKDMTDE